MPVNPIQKRKEVLALRNDAPIAQKKGKDVDDPTTSKSPSASERSNQPIVSREKAEKKDALTKEVEKNSDFNLESEIAKLKFHSFD